LGAYSQFALGIYGALFCAVLFSVLTIGAPALASPWAKENNQLLVISSADYFSAPLEPTSTLDGLVESDFKRLDSITYVEYGLTNDVTIGGKVVFGTSWLTRGTDIETATGFSEIEAFGQYQLFRSGQDAGAVRLTLARPSNFSSGARAELQSDGMDVDLSILYGRNLHARRTKIFTAIDAGFRKRLGNAADQVRIQTTLGFEPSERFLFLVDTFATISLRNEDIGGADFDIVKIQPSALWRISNRWGLQVGVTEEITGRNITLGRTFFVGLWSSF